MLDREGVSHAKVLSNIMKQKCKGKAGKWEVPIPKVKPVADNEMFKVLWAGKKKNKGWKRVVTKCTFVGENLMGDKSKALFNMSMCNDTLFLSIINVLDYSILVGIDEEKMELVVGIIDFMRQYDILKQMERVGKSTYHYSTSLIQSSIHSGYG